MQMHREHIPQRPVYSTVLPCACSTPYGVGPSAISDEWVWQARVEAAAAPVCEAEGENFEGLNATVYEGAPELVVEEGAPLGRPAPRRWGTCHELKGFAKVGRVLEEVHGCAVEWLIYFV